MSHNTSLPWAERGRETNFVGKLIHSRAASCYCSDGYGSLCATAQSKSNYLNIGKTCLNQDFIFLSSTLNI
jgi:hypothetical protein